MFVWTIFLKWIRMAAINRGEIFICRVAFCDRCSGGKSRDRSKQTAADRKLFGRSRKHVDPFFYLGQWFPTKGTFTTGILLHCNVRQTSGYLLSQQPGLGMLKHNRERLLYYSISIFCYFNLTDIFGKKYIFHFTVVFLDSCSCNCYSTYSHFTKHAFIF